jgi:hypothetical protein
LFLTLPTRWLTGHAIIKIVDRHLTKAAERLRRGDYYCRRLGAHLSWIGDLGGLWDEIDFHETRDTGFLLASLDRRPGSE